MMLFAVRYSRRPIVDDEGMRRLIAIFLAWTPATSVEVYRHYHYARGGAGLVLLDVASAAALYQALTTFDAIIEYTVEPLLEIGEAVAIKVDVDAWISEIGAAQNGARSLSN